MDILIKNMKLPKKMECLEILLFHDGYTSYRVHERDEWTSTKAIELPPHGDLIGRDAVLNELKKYYKAGELAEVGEVVCFIDEAEVVLERTT